MKASFAVLALSFFLISCGDSGSSGAAATSTGGASARGKQLVNAQSQEEREQLDPTENANSTTQIGRVYINTTYTDSQYQADTQSTFYNKVVSFLSPQLSANEVGDVDGSYNSSETGIAFWGKGFNLRLSELSSGQETQDYFSDDRNNAEFRISVHHKIKGSLIEIPVHFNTSTREADSGGLTDSYLKKYNDNLYYAQLVFEDEYGKLSIGGNIYLAGNPTFRGTVLFRNLKDKEGGAVNHDAELLGEFVVNALGFFNIQR